VEIDRQSVTAQYYRVVEPQLVAGRLPTQAELAAGAPVIVVSESVARAYWPGGHALGRVLAEFGTADEYRVVGIVKDVRWHSWDTEIASIYGPYARLSREPLVTILMRTRGPVAAVIDEALRAIESVDPAFGPSRAASLDDLFLDSVRARRFQAWLFGSFAAAATVIVGACIFGLLAMWTARRTKELGIRQALGASRHGLVRLMIREQLAPVAVGLTAGGAIAAWATRFIDTFFYEVTVTDPRIWLAAVAVLLTTAAVGVFVPALRASRSDPVQALRLE
jgi:hypothetical protein